MVHRFNTVTHEGKSAAIFCRWVAALFPGMFRNFYFVENHRNADNSTTTKASKKISTDLESL